MHDALLKHRMPYAEPYWFLLSLIDVTTKNFLRIHGFYLFYCSEMAAANGCVGRKTKIKVNFSGQRENLAIGHFVSTFCMLTELSKVYSEYVK